MERKITIEESVLYKEDYQIQMLLRNQIDGFLPMKGRGMDKSSCFDYDVSGKVSVKAIYERSKINSKDIKIFLKQLRNVLREVENHLLNKHCVLLKPEYIFYEEERYYFCYFPLSETDFWEEFHVLTEFFVKRADYEDKECVRIVFLLHKETMEENYSLEKIIEKCLDSENIQIENVADNRVEEESVPEIFYDTADHDWIIKQTTGSSILRETDNMWTPVKRFLTKQKKSKWGNWDELYVEEEEF